MSIAQRIAADIEGRIRSGEWRPGRRIPFEHELVAHYGCARATVSKALGSLSRAGLIERRRRAGSFVAHPHVRSAVLEIPDIAAVIAARGQDYRFEVVTRRIRRRRAECDEEAGFAADEQLLQIEGVHHAAGEPFGHEERLISLAAVPSAREAAFGPVSPGSWLLANVPWTEARHRISAVAAGAMAGLLGLDAGAPCLCVERWTWRMGAAVTFARQCFPGDRYDLVADFAPARSR